MFRKVMLALLLVATGVSAHATLNTSDIAAPSFNADRNRMPQVTFNTMAAETDVRFSIYGDTALRAAPACDLPRAIRPSDRFNWDIADSLGNRDGQISFSDDEVVEYSATNWTIDATNSVFEATSPNSTAFTLAAVPEPESYAMFLTGLGLMGFIASRRRTR